MDNRDCVFDRPIHPSEVDLRKYIANRDNYLYFDITSQVEFNTILHQDCLCHQDEAKKAHFYEQGLPGYQPFLLQDGVFSTRSGETNYRYQCMARVVHPVAAARCHNNLPVVLRLPQHLSPNTALNTRCYYHLLPRRCLALSCSRWFTKLTRDGSLLPPVSIKLLLRNRCRSPCPAAPKASSVTKIT